MFLGARQKPIAVSEEEARRLIKQVEEGSTVPDDITYEVGQEVHVIDGPFTWLWFKSDSENGTVGLESGQSLSVLFEGPLSFAHEGNGAFLTVLKKGTPVHSAEAKTCLLSGKKLVSARITFALDDVRVWSFNLAADRFVVRSLRLPKSDGFLDAPSRFQERMVFLDEWREIFLDLYRLYLSVRTNPRRGAAELRAIRDWRDREAFGRKCLLNIAASGRFSADRSIREYAERIWEL